MRDSAPVATMMKICSSDVMTISVMGKEATTPERRGPEQDGQRCLEVQPGDDRSHRQADQAGRVRGHAQPDEQRQHDEYGK